MTYSKRDLYSICSYMKPLAFLEASYTHLDRRVGSSSDSTINALYWAQFRKVCLMGSSPYITQHLYRTLRTLAFIVKKYDPEFPVDNIILPKTSSGIVFINNSGSESLDMNSEKNICFIHHDHTWWEALAVKDYSKVHGSRT